MDDNLLLRPLEPSDLTDREPAPEAPAGGSGWWPVIAVVASVIALLSLIRDTGEPRSEQAAEATTPPVSAPVTSPVTQVTAPPETVPPAPSFDPPLLGRVWNSELVLVDTDVVRFVDLATGEVRSADVAEEIRPPVAFYQDSIAFSNGRDLIRVTPGFANPRIVRADAREVSPLPGLPVAFHDHDSAGLAEIVVVGDEMGSVIWLEAGSRPLAMWNGRVLASNGERIELITIDGSASEHLADGTVLAASGGAVLYRSCADLDPSEAEGQGDAAGLLTEPADDSGCPVLLMRRDRSVTPSVQLPESALAVSIGPNGNHVIFVAPDERDPGVAIVFVAATEEAAPRSSVATLDRDVMIDWPEPMWSHDGSAAVIAGRDGNEMIDVETGGAIDVGQIIGDVEGEVVGFVSIRHAAGITSPADGSGTAAG
jgi:hypothetical protein